MKLTAKEIARILNKDRSVIARRAKRENWLFIEEKSERGKPTKYYIIEDLPNDLKDEILHIMENDNVQSQKNHNVQIMCNNVHSQTRIKIGNSKGTENENAKQCATDENAAHYENGGETGNTEKGLLVGGGLINFLEETNQPNQPENSPTNQPDEHEIWLTTNEVSNLTGISIQAINKNCKSGKYKAVWFDGQGRGGKTYKVALSSLPEKAQIGFLEKFEEIAKGLNETQRGLLGIQAQWKWFELFGKRLEVGMAALNSEKLKARLNYKVKILDEVENMPFGWSRTAWVKHIAKKHGISYQTIFRDMKIVKESGIKGLAKQRSKPLTAWDSEALLYLKGVYLKALKQNGVVSKKRAYEATLERAKKEGWATGKLSSAFTYLRELNPLLEKYATGGRQALDNVFYIARSTKDLSAFEMIVGDQHRFDFWVKDIQSGDVFRPECFLWLDMRTRLVYGISIGRHYDKYMVSHALRMGLMRFGKFKSCYTDNGKPELSKYVDRVMSELAGWGDFENKDVCELYKTDEGKYAVVDDKDDVIELVDTRQAWHRHIKARAYNAKAKPIERFFRGFEALLRDMDIPGVVTNKNKPIAEQMEDSKRIKELIDKDRLLSFEEFVSKVFEAVEKYNNRKHRTLRRSPMEELMYTVQHEGFAPIYMDRYEIDYILLAREIRKVHRGRITLNNIMYEGDELRKDDLKAGLWHLRDGYPVEVRFDPLDDSRVIAVIDKNKNDYRLLEKVKIGSMKNEELTQKLIAEKRRMIKAVIAQYSKLTKPIEGILEYSKTASAVKRLEDRKLKEPEAIDYERIKQETEKALKEAASQKENAESILTKKKVFTSDWERYKYCFESKILGNLLTESDMEFMRAYEAKMDKDDIEYWESYKSVLGGNI
jgi:putative transposase